MKLKKISLALIGALLLLSLGASIRASAAAWDPFYTSPVAQIKVLGVYNDKLYAGGHSSVQTDAHLFVYDVANGWGETTLAPGVGESFDLIESLQVLNNRLYIGLRAHDASSYYARVYYYDGTSFIKDFSTDGAYGQSGIEDLEVHNGILYAANGAYNKGEVFQRNGDNDWSSIGGKLGGTGLPARALASFKGNLYVGSGSNASIWRLNGSTWELNANLTTLLGVTQNSVWSLAATNDYLYAGLVGSSSSGCIPVYDGITTWSCSRGTMSHTRLEVINDQIWAGNGNGPIYWNSGSWQDYGTIPTYSMDFSAYGNYIYAAGANGIIYRTAFPNKYSISGTIVDTNGIPMGSVTISDGLGHSGVSNSLGRYSIDDLESGIYTLTPSRAGYNFDPSSSTVTVVANTVQEFVGTPVQWTLMFYLAGDNALNGTPFDTLYLSDINSLETVADNLNVNIVVLFDGRGANDSAYYKLKYDADQSQLAAYTEGADKVSLPGDADMSNPDTLSTFVAWAKANYPANHYGLVVADHGNGLNGLALDNGHGGNWMSVKKLGEALDAASGHGTQKLDVVYANACLMGMIEVGYQIRNFASYYVASENPGWLASGQLSPYPSVVRAISSATTAEDLAISFADEYANSLDGIDGGDNNGYTVSAVDLAKIGDVVNGITFLTTDLRANMSDWKTSISDARTATQKFDSNNDYLISGDDKYIDLYDFAEEIKARISDSAIQTDADALMTAIGAYIKKNRKSDPGTFHYPELSGSKGVSILFPRNTKETYYKGLNLDFASDAVWGVGASSLPSLGAGDPVGWGPLLVEYLAAAEPDALEVSEPPALAPMGLILSDVYLPILMMNY